jgi:N6-adenosine-specific RNA methylase IME4
MIINDLTKYKRKVALWVMDPPLEYKRKKSCGAADNHYNVMPVEEIIKIDLLKNSADDCMLGIWGWGPKTTELTRIVDGLGFDIVTILKIWIKTKNGNIAKKALGSYTRQVAEIFYLCKRKGCNIRKYIRSIKKAENNLLFAERRKHSEKPREIFEFLDRYFFDVPKVELYSRDPFNKNWDYYGDEVTKYIHYDYDLNELVEIRKKQDLLLLDLNDCKSYNDSRKCLNPKIKQSSIYDYFKKSHEKKTNANKETKKMSDLFKNKNSNDNSNDNNDKIEDIPNEKKNIKNDNIINKKKKKKQITKKIKLILF